MSMKAIRKAQQITVDAIATTATTGVIRALDARQAAGVELSNEELSHVNGGVTLPGIVAGGIIDLLYRGRVSYGDPAPRIL
jgi:bacteriocin-like protein